jgi:uncharacterized membrane protein YbhN (UPF0104 family)
MLGAASRVCLHAVGGNPSWPVVFGAYAIDRVLTLAVFMPGAAGVSELGVAAALVALGGAPAVAGGLLAAVATLAAGMRRRHGRVQLGLSRGAPRWVDAA